VQVVWKNCCPCNETRTSLHNCAIRCTSGCPTGCAEPRFHTEIQAHLAEQCTQRSSLTTGCTPQQLAAQIADTTTISQTQISRQTGVCRRRGPASGVRFTQLPAPAPAPRKDKRTKETVVLTRWPTLDKPRSNTIRSKQIRSKQICMNKSGRQRGRAKRGSGS